MAIFSKTLPSVYRESARILKLCAARHDVPATAAPDMQDSKPSWQYLPDGSPVSSLLLPQDFERGVDQPVRNVIIAGVIATSVIAGSVVALIAFLFSFDVWSLFIATALLVQILSAFFIRKDVVPVLVIGALGFLTVGLAPILWALFWTRPKGLDSASSRSDSLHAQAVQEVALLRYIDSETDARRIRQKQADRSGRDASPFITIGTASGVLRRHGDPFAPDSDMPVGLTVNDLSMHLAILGRTGTGKTVAIRKVVSQYCAGTDGGLFAICGKGTLPAELVGAAGEGYVLLNPETAKLALFQGMSAVEVSDALAVSVEKQDPFFFSASRTMLKNCAVLLKALADAKVESYKFTPRNLLTMINDNGGVEEIEGKKMRVNHGAYRARAIVESAKIQGADGSLDIDRGGLLTSAFEYFERELPKIMESEKTFAGVLMQCNNWIEPLFTNEAIAQWANLDEGEDVTLCCTGKRIGLDVPATRYGQAAAAIVANLVRQRLYVALKRRGNGWKGDPDQKPVMIVVDEMHLIWQPASGDGMDDNSMVSIARSLGGAFVVGTQSLDEMEARFGAERTLASLGNFRNFLCYDATEKTLQYASARAGYILRPLHTINNDQTKVNGVNMFAALSQAYLTPSDHGGSLGSGGAKVAKKLRINPAYYVAKTFSSGKEDADVTRGDMSSVVEDAGRATYAAITSEELNIYLSETFAALAVIHRAGAPRRDIIIIDPASS